MGLNQTGLNALVGCGCKHAGMGSNGLRVTANVGLDPFGTKEALATVTELHNKMKSLGSDIAINVKDPAFLAEWKSFSGDVGTFTDANDTIIKIIAHGGPGVVGQQARRMDGDLANWYKRYATLTNKAPTSAPPVPPTLPPDPVQPGNEKPDFGWSATTWLWILGITGTVGVVGYGYYRFNKAGFSIARKVASAV